MNAQRSRAVVLLHGLYEAGTDPFGDLLVLERDFLRAGFTSLRFDWPDGFTPRRAVQQVIDPTRSFSATLAKHLDEFLRREVAATFADDEWVVVAHSGGGNTWYRWLLGYFPAFATEFSTRPSLVFSFAAPYQCVQQALTLPNGLRIHVREPTFDPVTLASALMGTLVVVAARDDTTALAEDTLFPPDVVQQGFVYQYVIDGADHRDICSHALSRQLVASHVRALGWDYNWVP